MSHVSIDPAFIFGSAGAGEWIILFIVILIVVGPKRLPDVARKLGRMMEMFRRAADEFKRQIMTMDQPPPPPYDPPPTQTDYDADGSSDPYGNADQGDYTEEDRFDETGHYGENGELPEYGETPESGGSDVPGASPSEDGASGGVADTAASSDAPETDAPSGGEEERKA